MRDNEAIGRRMDITFLESTPWNVSTNILGGRSRKLLLTVIGPLIIIRSLKTSLRRIEGISSRRYCAADGERKEFQILWSRIGRKLWLIFLIDSTWRSPVSPNTPVGYYRWPEIGRLPKEKRPPSRLLTRRGNKEHCEGSRSRYQLDTDTSLPAEPPPCLTIVLAILSRFFCLLNQLEKNRGIEKNPDTTSLRTI